MTPRKEPDFKDPCIYTRKDFLRLTVAGICSMFLPSCEHSGTEPRASAGGTHGGGGTPIYLTFDDGPGPYTAGILDALQGAPATFFMLGRHVDQYQSECAWVRANGNTVGNHGYGHPNYHNMSLSQISDDIEAGATAIRNATGVTPTLVRPPYLYSQPEVRSICDQRGYRMILGEMTEDYSATNSEALVNFVLDHLDANVTLIFHDSDEGGGADRTVTREAIRILVPRLWDLGYSPSPL